MISRSTADTRKLARDLALSHKKKIFALVGDLGSGKTTFAQSFLKALGIKGKITSPTFVLIKRYGHIFHIDAYRLDEPIQLIELGFKDIIKNKVNIALVEWADRVKELIPKNAQWIYFKHGKNKNERIITMK